MEPKLRLNFDAAIFENGRRQAGHELLKFRFGGVLCSCQLVAGLPNWCVAIHLKLVPVRAIKEENGNAASH